MRSSFFSLLFALSIGSAHGQAVLTADLNPGTAASDPRYLSSFNGKLFFQATDGTHGAEICSLSAAGKPAIAYDLNPGSSSSGTLAFAQHYAMMAGKMYFCAKTPTDTNKLFVYDGINSPRLAPGMNGPAEPKNISDITVASGNIYFSSSKTLYRYDGLSAPVIAKGSTGLNPSELTPYNNMLCFTGATNGGDQGVYIYDAAADTCYNIISFPSAGPGTLYVPGGYTVADGKLFFAAHTATYGWELYRYDGSTTSRITDLAPGAANGARGGIAVLNNTIYFGGSIDGSSFQLYKYDDLNDTSTLVQTINPAGNSRINNLSVCNGLLYFSATTSAAGNEPWVWNGTSASMVADVNPGIADSYPSEFYGFNGCVYFNGQNVSSGFELFRIGTPNSVEKTSFDGQVLIYPNPARSNAKLALTLAQPKNLVIRLCDAGGACVWERNAQNFAAGKTELNISLDALAPGTYFYFVLQDDYTSAVSGRLIKE